MFNASATKTRPADLTRLHLPTAGSGSYTVHFGTPIELVQAPMADATVKYTPEVFRMGGLQGNA